MASSFSIIWLLVAIAHRGAATRQLHQNAPATELKVPGEVVIAQSPPERLPSANILDDLRDQDRCIKTPEEYVAAFEAREARCVDPDLVGRTSSGVDVAGATLNTSFKLAYFWVGSDALAKYLRIGFPETIGDFTVDHRQNYTNEDFAGVQQVSNGQALLEAIGWPGNFANITRVYVLNIFSKQAIANVVSSPRQDAIYRSYFRANIEPISPTWSNVKDYMNWAFTDIGLRVSERVVTVLNDFDFQDLTGCPTQCAYTLADFPGSGVASVPITIEPRENGTEACPSTLDLLETKNINASLTAPTAVDEASSLCKGNTFGGVRRTWIDKYQAMLARSQDPDTGFCSYERIKKTAVFLKDRLENSRDVVEQTMWFRAFLIQHCIGYFNTLFAGNGLTYTGFGGLLSAEGTEYITSPFDVNAVPSSKKVAIPFCVNGLNGGRPDGNGRCPAPTDFNAVIAKSGGSP